MKTVTFKMDVELNDLLHIKEGTTVKVSDNEVYLNRWENTIPVVIDSAYSYKDKLVRLDRNVVWFSVSSFI
ncbi:hypothetical protein WKH57_01020 [Niallia taxi]|uniref:hypothetical protein n=1 Tax=Niallia taxi TaxID=2499688 RepID=UPI003180159B